MKLSEQQIKEKKEWLQKRIEETTALLKHYEGSYAELMKVG